VGVGAIVFHGGRVLLVLRGIEPNKDLWAIPGGSLKLGETLQAGAEREIFEETGVVIRAGRPILSFDSIRRDAAGRIRFHYVVVDMEAEYLSGEPRGADDALDARWFSPEELAGVPVSPTTLQLLRAVGFTGSAEPDR
jgi:ADP-ribose pyrophosphatase